MTSSKFRNPLVAAAILALAAVPALRLGLWLEAGFDCQWIPEGAGRRRLRSSWDNDVRRVHARILVARGHDPESRKFRNLLDQRTKDFNKGLHRAQVLERLDQSKEVWLRGDHVRQVEERRGKLWREEEVKAAASAANIFEVSQAGLFGGIAKKQHCKCLDARFVSTLTNNHAHPSTHRRSENSRCWRRTTSPLPSAAALLPLVRLKTSHPLRSTRSAKR